MSRAERRAYKRLTKNQDPYALPASAAQRAKIGRQRARRPQRSSGEFRFWSGRFLTWALAGGALAGLIGFSLAWPSGVPFALYVGLAVTVGWLALAWVVRSAQGRAAAKR